MSTLSQNNSVLSRALTHPSDVGVCRLKEGRNWFLFEVTPDKTVNILGAYSRVPSGGGNRNHGTRIAVFDKAYEVVMQPEEVNELRKERDGRLGHQ